MISVPFFAEIFPVIPREQRDRGALSEAKKYPWGGIRFLFGYYGLPRPLQGLAMTGWLDAGSRRAQ